MSSSPTTRRGWHLPLTLAWLVVLGAGAWTIALEPRMITWISSLVPNLGLVFVGSIIVSKTEQKAIGWILMTLGAGFQIMYLAFAATQNLPNPPPIAATADELGAILIALVGVLFLLFPEGRFPLRSWRWMAIAILVAAGLDVALAFESGPVVIPSYWEVGIGALMMLVIVSMHIGYYRKRNESQRRQIKWFLLAVFAAALLYLVAVLLDVNDEAFIVIDGIATTIWPIAILVAITRYKLYDIDRIFSRTIAYALVVGMLAVVYVAGAVWLPTRIRGGDVPPVYVAGTTLAVIVLFNPLRKRLVSLVDRRFNRSRYDNQRVMEGFGASVADVVDESELAERMKETISVTMQPSAIGVWIKT